jgi:hypothetical protein
MKVEEAKHGCEVMTEVNVPVIVYWNMTPCSHPMSLVSRNRNQKAYTCLLQIRLQFRSAGQLQNVKIVRKFITWEQK